MKKFLLIAVCCLLVSSCTDKRGTTRALEKKGYTQIVTKGYKPFGCGFLWNKSYNTRTGFEATNKDGERVEGCVCKGPLLTTVKEYKNGH